MTKEEKESTIGLIGAFLSIPMAIFVWKADLNPGWAFILGIAYAAIWRYDDRPKPKEETKN